MRGGMIAACWEFFFILYGTWHDAIEAHISTFNYFSLMVLLKQIVSPNSMTWLALSPKGGYSRGGSRTPKSVKESKHYNKPLFQIHEFGSFFSGERRATVFYLTIQLAWIIDDLTGNYGKYSPTYSENAKLWIPILSIIFIFQRDCWRGKYANSTAAIAIFLKSSSFSVFPDFICWRRMWMLWLYQIIIIHIKGFW